MLTYDELSWQNVLTLCTNKNYFLLPHIFTILLYVVYGWVSFRVL